MSGDNRTEPTVDNNGVIGTDTKRFARVRAFEVGADQVEMPEQAADPAAVANNGFLYTKDVGGITYLFYRASNGTIYQVTPSGTTPATADITTLATLGPTTGLANGTLIWVTSRKRYFTLDTTSAATAIAGEIVAASGGGRWITQTYTSSLEWSTQAAWFINTATGSDDNTGATNVLPLLTWAEFARRVIIAAQPYTVTIAGNLAATDPITWAPQLQWDRAISATAPSLTVIGTETAGAVQVYAAGATIVAGNVASQFTIAAHGAWTVGQAIRTTTGAAAGTITFVTRDIGAGNAECTPWWLFAAGGSETAAPAAGNSLTEVSWSTAANVRVVGLTSTFRNLNFTAITTLRGTSYTFQECKLPGFGTLIGFQATCTGCHINNGSLSGQAPGSIHLFQGSFIDRTATTSAIMYNAGSEFSFQSCLVRGNVAGTTPGIAVSGIAGTTTSPFGMGLIRLTQFFDIGNGTTAGLDISLGGMVRIFSAFGGAGNGIAVRVVGGQLYINTGITPTVTGTTELSVDGAANQIPPLVAGLVVPLAAPITTFAQWNAAPFARFYNGNGTGSVIANCVA